MDALLFCLDSGTTAVKAAAFDRRGRIVAAIERPNGALRRDGAAVEQDMAVTRDEAFAVLRDCAAAAAPGGRAEGLVVTGQGDGLWPVDAAGAPVGRALTWLDGRARILAGSLGLALDAVQSVTGSRPTAASASLQLLWLQRNDPARLARIAHALRLKEWLALSLTGRVAGEPVAALPVWGDWRSGAVSEEIEAALGLDRGLALLPPFAPVGACRAPLAAAAAAATGLPAGIPVLIGPGDVQATLTGLGLGTRPEIARASIFGTSSIHACLHADPAALPEAPAGAMVQRFALGDGFLCFHPGFNGATLLRHLERQFADLPAQAAPRYSGLVLHPFFEPGGERAPWTDPHATGALLGLDAATTPAEIAWAGREALAFAACHSHALLHAPEGVLALGGGLAGDAHFARFLATALGAPAARSPGGHAGLRGLAAVGARFLYDAPAAEIAEVWIGPPAEIVAPETGAVAAYAAAKRAAFCGLVDAARPFWPALAALRAEAKTLMESA